VPFHAANRVQQQGTTTFNAVTSNPAQLSFQLLHRTVIDTYVGMFILKNVLQSFQRMHVCGVPPLLSDPCTAEYGILPLLQ
jgi:hypothetical protein